MSPPVEIYRAMFGDRDSRVSILVFRHASGVTDLWWVHETDQGEASRILAYGDETTLVADARFLARTLQAIGANPIIG